MRTARLISLVASLGALSFAADARAADPTPSKQECVAANESAQTSRQNGKLREARQELLLCIAKSCPGPVREDCAQRLNDVDSALPTIVLIAKGSDGADLTAVSVKMDGAPLVDKLDGTAIAVDPGEHTFELAAAGHPSVTKKVVLHEGEKNRNETITFASATPNGVVAPPPPVPTTSTPTPPESNPEGTSTRGNGQRTLGLIVGGVGVAGVATGVVFGLIASSTYNDAKNNHCPTTTTCDPDGVSGGSTAHTQATVSTVAVIAGGALVAGGVVLYLTAPKHGDVSVQTTAGAGSFGLRVGGSF
ncbi:MAG TPA: hypothetical protein VF407_22185 [Polyangiaceae bacterium]